MDTQEELFRSVLNSEYKLSMIIQEIDEFSYDFFDIGMGILESCISYNESALNQYGDELSNIIAILQNTTQYETMNTSINNVNDSVSKIYDYLCTNIDEPISSLFDSINTSILTKSAELITTINTLKDILSNKINDVNTNLQNLVVLNLLKTFILDSVQNMSQSSTAGTSDPALDIFDKMTAGLMTATTVEVLKQITVGSAAATATTGGVALPLLIASTVALALSFAGHLLNDSEKSSGNNTIGYTDEQIVMLMDKINTLLNQDTPADIREETYNEIINEILNPTSIIDSNTAVLNDYAPVRAVNGSAIEVVYINSEPPDQSITEDYLDINDISTMEYDISPWMKKQFDDYMEKNELPLDLKPGTPYAVYSNYPTLDDFDKIINSYFLSTTQTSNEDYGTSKDNDISTTEYDISPWMKKQFDDYMKENGSSLDLEPGAPYAVYNNYPTLDDLNRIISPYFLRTSHTLDEDRGTSKDTGMPYRYDQNITGFLEDYLILTNNSDGYNENIEIELDDLSQLRDTIQSENVKVVKIKNTPNITISFGDVHETADVNQVAGSLNRILREEMARMPEGVYLQ